jgi:ATP-dependent exoDNAse (exonuclease V) alpha subunit
MMLQRNVLYTAVTRTKQLVILVGLSTDPLRWVLSPLILSPAMKG